MVKIYEFFNRFKLKTILTLDSYIWYLKFDDKNKHL